MMRVPQSGQKEQRLIEPSSPRVSQVCNRFWLCEKSISRGFILNDMPKALDDCR
jgi:hypothetical protein